MQNADNRMQGDRCSPVNKRCWLRAYSMMHWRPVCTGPGCAEQQVADEDGSSSMQSWPGTAWIISRHVASADQQAHALPFYCSARPARTPANQARPSARGHSPPVADAAAIRADIQRHETQEECGSKHEQTTRFTRSWRRRLCGPLISSWAT